jgi:hypothetical protein
MKKTMFILGVDLLIVGCKQQGGTSDQYNTERGSSSMTNTPSSGPSSQSGQDADKNAAPSSSQSSTNTTPQPAPTP